MIEDQKEIKVEVNNLTKKFGDLLVLDNITFKVKKGEFLCVVGPTGCGKTTFLNLLTRLIEPTDGDILIDGRRADPQKQNISFVFQESSAFPWLTVEENIAFGLKIKGYKKDYLNERVNMIIALLGLDKFRRAYPSQLSASLEQRVVIGRAFATNPDLLLMDEPYGQMDIKTRYYLEDEVIKIWEKLNSTVIFVTHNVEEAVYLAERILILSQKPTCIKKEIIIDLPRPRNLIDPQFVNIRKEVTDMIKWW